MSLISWSVPLYVDTRVSKVEITTPIALIYKVLFLSISTHYCSKTAGPPRRAHGVEDPALRCMGPI